MCFIRFAATATLAALLIHAPSFGQSVDPTTQPKTFHVGGTITSSSGYPVDGAKVTFHRSGFSRTVVTNNKGIYEADLPLGDYSMTIKSLVFRVCHRPLFRVASPTRITFDFALHPTPIGTDVPYDNRDPKMWDSVLYDISSYGEEFLAAPSGDGVPFQLYVHYVSRSQIEHTYTYAGLNYSPYKNPVFVAYNLFSLQADKVEYDAQSRTLAANGNVVVMNESGVTHRAESIMLKIANGQAVPQR